MSTTPSFFDHDVIVVGARGAGASTAMLLARHGYDVLVVDRTSLPADTVRPTHSPEATSSSCSVGGSSTPSSHRRTARCAASCSTPAGHPRREIKDAPASISPSPAPPHPRRHPCQRCRGRRRAAHGPPRVKDGP